MQEYFGYVYIWFDTMKRKFCIGSHHGKTHDAYTTSTGYCALAIKKRPETFRFRVLEYNFEDDKKITLKKEQKWLNFIKPEELGNKYYNFKRFASGGNCIEGLSEEKLKKIKEQCSIASKKYWANLCEEELVNRKNNAFGGNTFDRSYLQKTEYKRKMANSVTGPKNGFYGKTHSDEIKNAIGVRSKNNKYRAKQYVVELPDGKTLGPFLGCREIEEYFKLDQIKIPLKWYRFIGKNIRVTSNRKGASDHPLYNSLIGLV